MITALGLNKNVSGNTLEQVKLDYEVRFQTLKGLEATEVRVGKELVDLRDRIAAMQADVSGKFDRVDTVRRELEKEKEELRREAAELAGMKEKLAKEAADKTYDFDIREKKLKNHDAYPGYNKLEKELRDQEAQKYYLRYNINTKNKDMKYEDLKGECLGLVGEVNATIAK